MNELAESGEALARSAEAALKGGDIDALFDAAQAHMNQLNRVGEAGEAFATGVMAMLTAFGARFNPAGHVRGYLTVMMSSALSAAMAMQMAQQQADAFAIEHYTAIDAEFGPLALASYRELRGAEVLPQIIAGPYEMLQGWVDSEACFDGRPIVATMAVEILYDVASRLTAMGIIE